MKKKPQVKGKNLLIIDDEEQLLINLSYLFKKYADQVFTAQNGKEGLAILEEHAIHCVISDVSMPELNGIEVIRRLRSQGNEVPFIFYTALKNYELMVEAAKYGAFDFLTKPIFEELESVVAHGLKLGFNKDWESNRNPSEYQAILQELEEGMNDE